MKKVKESNILVTALIESWIGFGVLVAFVIEALLGGSSIVLGGLAVSMAVLFMNGLAKTDIFLTQQGPSTCYFLKYRQE